MYYNIKKGMVVYIYDNMDLPQLVIAVNLGRRGSVSFDTQSLYNNEITKNLDFSDVTLAKGKEITEEYKPLINKKFINLLTGETESLKVATTLKVLNGKEMVEQFYEEWDTFYSPENELSNYFNDVAIPLNEVDLDAVYAVDISGRCYLIQSIEDLENAIEQEKYDFFIEKQTSK